MKKVAIIGKGSYLGRSIIERLSNIYSFLEFDVADPSFDVANVDLTGFDVCINVSAIVHRPKEKKELFYTVNRDLAFKIASLAKKCKVKLFIQFSTKGVFGLNNGVVNEMTQTNPKTLYEKSKLQADELIFPLNDSDFCVSIIRPPMIYGKGCKGNYPRLERFALKSPFFPNFKNKKDLIYIGNVVDFVKYIIEKNLGGFFYPRNPEPICISDMVYRIAKIHDKKILMTKFFNPLIYFLVGKNKTITSMFADCYCIIDDKSGYVSKYSLQDSLEEMYCK